MKMRKMRLVSEEEKNPKEENRKEREMKLVSDEEKLKGGK